MTYAAGRHFLQIPGPTNVPDSVLRAMAAPTIDHRGPEFAELGRELLRDVKPVFGTTNPVIMYPASGTGAWEAALVNTLSPGDAVLCFETGHFATLWQEMARRLGLDVELVPGDWRHGVDPARVAERLAADTAHRIRAVCVVHNETSTGVTSRVPEVRAAMDAAEHPALLVVDTISSLGSIDYRHDEWGVDVTVAGSQKGLMLPPGMSFNAVSDKALDASRSATLPRSFWDWGPMLAAGEHGMFPYTPNTNLLYGLREALRLLYAEGLPERVRAARATRGGDPRRRARLGARGALPRRAGALRLADRRPGARGAGRGQGPRDRAGPVRHVARRRAGPARGHGVPDRPPRRVQRPDARRHPGRRPDGTDAGRCARRPGGPRRRVGTPAGRAMTAELTTAGAPARPIEALEDVLRSRLAGEVAFDDYTRHLFSRDASMYAIEPRGVVYPRDADDVAAAVRTAGEFGIPVVPRGAGTSLAGQTVGPGLVLDMSRHMNAIVEIDPAARTAVVEVGVVQDQLNAAAAAHGLMFGPDTSTSNRATIGGMVGNNSAGSGSLTFGMTIDHVRALDVVLADGATARLEPVDEVERARRAGADTLEGRLYRELPVLVGAHEGAIAEGMPAFWRRACGYRLDRLAGGGPFDLAKFVVGAEGTLVVATRAVVDLVPKPKRTVYAVGHFDTTHAAVSATVDALGCAPNQVEMMDKTILDLSRGKREYADLGNHLVGDPAALLFVSFSGDDDAALESKVDEVAELWARHGHGYHTLKLVTPAQQAALLKVRKSSLGLLMAAGEGTRRPLAFVEDTAVPPEHLAEYTQRFAAILDEHGLQAGFYGHCSVGCLHIRPFVDLTDPEQVATMRTVAEKVKDLVAEYGGVNSSEHGDGLARSEFNREIFGDELYEAMREVKRLFDPAGVLNPGKIVDAPPMTENLRDRDALPPAPGLRTMLSFEVVGGGMRDAADRCMNIGLCRKTAGVMCPSYQATLQEEHSTRGRANALVKALSEPDPAAALADDRLDEVLDLCLMCKACKSECPMGVDLAALKAETLHHRHAVHGTPLRSRIFGAIRSLNRLGSATAPVSNLPGRIRPLRALAERAVGITARRPLPRFVRENLVRWHRRRTVTPAGSAGPVTWLADSFTTYTEPHIGRAAIELLEAAGHTVELAADGCCGRSSLSKGLLDDARRQAGGLVTSLERDTAPGSPIVGCEPSCVFTLRDETRSLIGDLPQTAAVAARVRQVEELIVEAVDDGRLRLDPTRFAGRRVVFHGHCHQKAEVGTAATMAVLRSIPGLEVAEIDAGCCGMAGSFGFEAEHYETSMTVGRDRLLPAIEREPADTLVAATGVSCRQQIFHGAGRTAWHPLELVRDAVIDPALS